jgi:hypothetical protein
VAYFDEGRWHVSQKVLGSIAWPQTTGAEPYVPPPEQFQVKVTAGVEEGEWQLQVAKGRVITGGGRSAVAEWDVQGFAIYPTGANVVGTDTASPYVNQGGHVKITDPTVGGSYAWGVYIVSNPASLNFPMLAVMAYPSDAYTKSTPWTAGVSWIDVSPYTDQIIIVPSPPAPSPELHLKSYDTVEGNHQYNYNCQRLKVAELYWDGTFSQWTVRQWLIGSLTNPDINWHIGNKEYEVFVGEPPPAWATTTLYETEQNEWNGPWAGYSKWDGTGSAPSQNLLTF